MPRRATGQIVERKNARGGISRTLRFHSNGKRRTVPLGEVPRDEAERQLSFVLADVARGAWRPPAAVEAPRERDTPVTFHEFAEEWWIRHERQIIAKTRTDYRWRLEKHLLGYFGEMRLDAITFDTVERYIAGKLAGIVYEGGREVRRAEPLSPRSINMTTTLMGAILEGAVERELIPRNPARGKGRRVRERAPARSYLETAAQIEALLDAAGELDREATRERRHIDKRAILATMIFAGLRIGELCSLRWRDVDLAAGWLTVGASKTDAGRRRVKIRGALADELARARGARRSIDHDGFVFPTRTGRRQYECKVRGGTLGGAVKRANENLSKRDLPPLPGNLTPHSLRRTFASVLYALGESPPVVMVEMGHTSPDLALKVYAQAMRRGEDELASLSSLMAGEKAHKGTNGDVVPIERAKGRAA